MLNHFLLKVWEEILPQLTRVVFILSLENTVVTVTKDGEVKEKFKMNLKNIRSLRGFLSGEWNLSVYDDCFPKFNRLADMDGSTEINGYTLHIEFKVSKRSLNKGQMLKAIRQAKYSNITTFFVFGKTDAPVEYLKISPQNYAEADFVECDEASLKAAFKEWSDWTKENNLVENRTEEWDIVKRYTY
jgi:hypothetical protein